MVRACLLFPFALTLFAQERNFAGAQLGISTLSADGRSEISAASRSVSLYKPENSASGLVFAGRHLTDSVSLQGSYGWNGNDLRLTSVQVASGVERSYEQRRTSRHHTFAGELMIYFRPRASVVRPYLSAGPGVARFHSRETETAVSIGGAILPPREWRSTDLCLRVAVGIDLKLGRRAAFRYTFAETIQRNPISARLDPPGQRGLANFQNLFGFGLRF